MSDDESSVILGVRPTAALALCQSFPSFGNRLLRNPRQRLALLKQCVPLLNPCQMGVYEPPHTHLPYLSKPFYLKLLEIELHTCSLTSDKRDALPDIFEKLAIVIRPCP